MSSKNLFWRRMAWRILHSVIISLMSVVCAGCGAGRGSSYGASTEGIKITDLKPAYVEPIRQKLNISVAVFEIAAAKAERLEEAYKLLSRQAIVLNDGRGFEKNNLFAGSAGVERWGSFHEKIDALGARKLITEQMVFFDNQPQQIPVRYVALEREISYIDGQGAVQKQKIATGQLVWQFSLGEAIAGGPVEVVIEPQLLPAARLLLGEKIKLPVQNNSGDKVLAIARFSVQAGPSDFVVIGTSRYQGGIESLNGILFNVPGETPRVLLYVVFCSKVGD